MAFVMLSVIYANCRKIGLYAECHYAECRYAECRGAIYWSCLPRTNALAYFASTSVLKKESYETLDPGWSDSDAVGNLFAGKFHLLFRD
jgi:hypothetical protein